MSILEDPFARVVRDLESPVSAKRMEALALLSQFDSNQARPLYVQALHDEDEDCRLLAALRLARAQDIRAVRLVQTELDEENRPQYRLWMRLPAIGFGFVDEIPALVTDLCTVDSEAGEGRSWTQAASLAQLLADIGEPAERQLSEMAKHSNALVRWIAVLALQQYGTESAVSVVSGLRFDPDEQISEEVERVMEGRVRDLNECVEWRTAG